MQKLAWVPFTVLTLVAVGLLSALLLGSRGGSGAAQGRQLPDQGQQHITEFDTHPPYNSTPPTSGWHLPDVAGWGVHTEPIPDVLQVHNLEHGGVIVHYNCPTSCDALVRQLSGVVGRYPSKVVLAPYPPMKPLIALTAWTWIDELDYFDEGRVVAFIEAHKNKGPELIPD